MDSPNKREGEQQNSLFYEDDSHSNKQQISWLQRLFLGSHAVAGRRCRSIQDPLDQNQQKMLCKLTCYRCRSKHSSECSEIEGGKYRPIRRRKASLQVFVRHNFRVMIMISQIDISRQLHLSESQWNRQSPSALLPWQYVTELRAS